jgi:hypothetical protein
MSVCWRAALFTLMPHCRWDIVPPDHAAGVVEWEMHLSATHNIVKGESVLLDYGKWKGPEMHLSAVTMTCPQARLSCL